jgi:hypothetical protein
MDMPTLLAEVTWAWEVATAMEAARVTAILALETYAQEAATARDIVALRVNDSEDRGTLVEREALQSVSRVEVENAAALAYACEDAGGFVWKIALLEGGHAAEDRAIHTNVSPPRARHHLSEGMRLAALHHTEMAGELAALWAALSSVAESVVRHSPINTI